MSKSEYRAYQFAAKEPSKGSTAEDREKKLKDEIERKKAKAARDFDWQQQDEIYKKLKEKNKALDEQFGNPKYVKEWEKEWKKTSEKLNKV